MLLRKVLCYFVRFCVTSESFFVISEGFVLLRKVLCYFVRFCVTSEGFVLLRKV